jgi:hypothetical protein
MEKKRGKMPIPSMRATEGEIISQPVFRRNHARVFLFQPDCRTVRAEGAA